MLFQKWQCIELSKHWNIFHRTADQYVRTFCGKKIKNGVSPGGGLWLNRPSFLRKENR